MKKILVTALCGLGLIAGAAQADDAKMMMPKMPPVCKEAMDHQKSVRPMIDAAIKENNAQKVGELVIADHKFMEDFFMKHPECKHKMHEMKKHMKEEMKMEMKKDGEKMDGMTPPAPPAN